MRKIPCLPLAVEWCDHLVSFTVGSLSASCGALLYTYIKKWWERWYKSSIMEVLKIPLLIINSSMVLIILTTSDLSRAIFVSCYMNCKPFCMGCTHYSSVANLDWCCAQVAHPSLSNRSLRVLFEVSLALETTSRFWHQNQESNPQMGTPLWVRISENNPRQQAYFSKCMSL